MSSRRTTRSPDSVSLAEFGEFVRLAQELGSYA